MESDSNGDQTMTKQDQVENIGELTSFTLTDFGLPDKHNPDNNVPFSKDRFEQATKQWAVANDHTFVDAADYTNLNWTPGINKAEDIWKTANISLPATNAAGLKTLELANTWAVKNGVILNVNGMARPQAVQDYIRQQPKMFGVAAAVSTHRTGGIDLDYPRTRNGTVMSSKTDELKTFLKGRGYKLVDHNKHIHVSPL
tara:strand:- start:658 stop:1254 length:597 start_codon:yes stop_codon:yes gene_type:complete